MKALSEFLRPEFLSRVDEIIVFNELTKNDFIKIADLMLSEYIDTLGEKGIKLTYDEKAKEYLANKAFGVQSGARNLRQTIRRDVEDKIATAIITHREGEISAISLTADDSGLKMDVI